VIVALQDLALKLAEKRIVYVCGRLPDGVREDRSLEWIGEIHAIADEKFRFSVTRCAWILWFAWGQGLSVRKMSGPTSRTSTKLTEVRLKVGTSEVIMLPELDGKGNVVYRGPFSVSEVAAHLRKYQAVTGEQCPWREGGQSSIVSLG